MARNKLQNFILVPIIIELGSFLSIFVAGGISVSLLNTVKQPDAYILRVGYPFTFSDLHKSPLVMQFTCASLTPTVDPLPSAASFLTRSSTSNHVGAKWRQCPQNGEKNSTNQVPLDVVDLNESVVSWKEVDSVSTGDPLVTDDKMKDISVKGSNILTGKMMLWAECNERTWSKWNAV